MPTPESGRPPGQEQGQEGQQAEKMQGEIAACKSIAELANLLEGYGQIPGRKQVFNAAVLAGWLREFDADPKKQADYKAVKVVAATFLSRFTRSLGLRNKVGELTGLSEAARPSENLEKPE